jgi:drug/metabolite transporter (DMT)-like permease
MKSGFFQSKELRAILAMCAAMLLFVGNDVFNKLAREHWPTGQILVFRGLMALALLLPIVRAMGHWNDLVYLKNGAAFRRGALESVVAILFITALGLMPLQALLAALMAATLIGTALSVPMLGEVVGWRRWVAVLVGFVGMLLVLRPTGDVSLIAGVMALACAICVAIRDIATRFVPKVVPSIIITVATVLGALAGGLALLPFQTMAPFTWEVTGYLAGSAFFVVLGNFAAVMAFREVEIAIVSPFRYTNLVWGVIAGWFFFGEWPNRVMWIGVALIVASGLYALHRERIRHKERERLIAAGSVDTP